ncbi:matrixin family metalloprotease [Brevibacillus porteri]
MGKTNKSKTVTPSWGNKSGIKKEADIMINVSHNISSTSPSKSSFDLKSIMAHEMGHVVGLDDETKLKYGDSVMYESLSTNEIRYNLSKDDENGYHTISW